MQFIATIAFALASLQGLLAGPLDPRYFYTTAGSGSSYNANSYEQEGSTLSPFGFSTFSNSGSQVDSSSYNYYNQYQGFQ